MEVGERMYNRGEEEMNFHIVKLQTKNKETVFFCFTPCVQLPYRYLHYSS